MALLEQGTTHQIAGEEAEYLSLVKRVLEEGSIRSSRTNVSTISIFGAQCRYSLENNKVPLLTTRKMAWNSIKEELLWFLRGDTDAKKLSALGVPTWNGNTSRESLDRIGLRDYEEGDCGPNYGFQWRHWGADYEGKSADYAGKGADQIKRVVSEIRENPLSERLVVCAWNVCDVEKMARSPSHLLFQFYVNEDRLSCLLYQRSANLGLGVPFTIASYGLLTHMIAHVTGLRAYELVHAIGDAHVYLDHVGVLRNQIKIPPRGFPTVAFTRKLEDIDEFSSEDVELSGYDPYPAIKMNMAL